MREDLAVDLAPVEPETVSAVVEGPFAEIRAAMIAESEEEVARDGRW
jgi:hypothetical protein